jgi:hypothetical protein
VAAYCPEMDATSVKGLLDAVNADFEALIAD